MSNDKTPYATTHNTTWTWTDSNNRIFKKQYPPWFLNFIVAYVSKWW